MSRQTPAKSTRRASSQSESPHRPSSRIRTRAESVVQRALTVLETIARAGDGVSLSRIAEDARIPKPTVYRLLRELAEAGLVRREATRHGGFSAGTRLEQMALALLQNGGSRTRRHSILTALVAELGETCNITVLDGTEVLYVDRVESASPLRANLQPGSRVPLHCSASGKLFLARLPKPHRDRLLGQIRLEPATARTIADRPALDAELARIRTQGYAVDDEEYAAGLDCVAVPVLDAAGRTIAAVAVQAPMARLPRERTAETLPALRRAAQELALTYTERTGDLASARPVRTGS